VNDMSTTKQAASSTNLSAEIAATQATIDDLQRIGPTLAALQEQAVAELEKAKRFYEMRGLPWQQGGMSPGETFLAAVGFVVATNHDDAIATERKRVETLFKLRGSRGMADAEKRERLAVQHVKLRRLRAQQEQIAREREASGADVERDADPLAAEMFLRLPQDLAAIASGKETT
jgi:hypothetical protein